MISSHTLLSFIFYSLLQNYSQFQFIFRFSRASLQLREVKCTKSRNVRVNRKRVLLVSGFLIQICTGYNTSHNKVDRKNLVRVSSRIYEMEFSSKFKLDKTFHIDRSYISSGNLLFIVERTT